MSSSCTLVGCGMRNITSCFFARRIRFEDKADSLSRRSPETSKGSIVFDFRKRSDENGGISVESSSSRSDKINGGEGEPHVAEEDYLVFCFREDGAIDIINDRDVTTDDDDDAVLQKGDEKGSKEYEIKEMMKMDDFEACDSNLSDTSSGSFAFPVLRNEEGAGSPVYMPKHEGQSVRLHCCRF